MTLVISIQRQNSVTQVNEYNGLTQRVGLLHSPYSPDLPLSAYHKDGMEILEKKRWNACIALEDDYANE